MMIHSSLRATSGLSLLLGFMLLGCGEDGSVTSDPGMVAAGDTGAAGAAAGGSRAEGETLGSAGSDGIIGPGGVGISGVGGSTGAAQPIDCTPNGKARNPLVTH